MKKYVALTGAFGFAYVMAWLAVYKFDWRYTDVLGFTTAPFDDSSSFMVLLILSIVLGVLLTIFLLAFWPRKSDPSN